VSGEHAPFLILKSEKLPQHFLMSGFLNARN